MGNGSENKVQPSDTDSREHKRDSSVQICEGSTDRKEYQYTLHCSKNSIWVIRPNYEKVDFESVKKAFYNNLGSSQMEGAALN